jgi:hypothetical protein
VRGFVGAVYLVRPFLAPRRRRRRIRRGSGMFCGGGLLPFCNLRLGMGNWVIAV